MAGLEAVWQERLRFPLDGQRSLRGSGGVPRPFGAKSRKATHGAIRGKASSWSVLGLLRPSELFTCLSEKFAIITLHAHSL